MTTSDEFEPFLLYRVDGANFECALWTMPDARRAVALFMTSDSALVYREALGLSDEWKVYRPVKADLGRILKGAYQSGITQAVLDPNLESAHYVFDVQRVLREMGVLQS